MNKREQRRLNFISKVDLIFKNKLCWTDCVGWAFSNKLFGYKINNSKGCRQESIDNEFCYCGRFKNGKAFDELSQKEQEAERSS